MRITYDSEVDALYIRFIEATVTTRHVAFVFTGLEMSTFIHSAERRS